MDQRARQSTADGLRELADRIERDDLHHAELGMWHNLIVPQEPGELMEGGVAPDPDVTTSGSYVLQGGRLASVTVAQGGKACERLPLVHAAASAVAMKHVG